MTMMGPALSTSALDEPEERIHAQDEEEGPADGHTFRVVFDIKPSYRIQDDDEYRDAEDFDQPQMSIDVRAWNLRDALLKAAELPLKDWLE